MVDVEKHFLWPVPESWSLEQAATVPVVYTTAYYALVVRGNLRQGNKVLIHSGSGGVGQAAISIALHYGCQVFTTVGSAQKREYLKERFPELTDSCFFNSRDTSFEFGILKATQGKGKFSKFDRIFRRQIKPLYCPSKKHDVTPAAICTI